MLSFSLLGDAVGDCLQMCSTLSSNVAACQAQCKPVYGPPPVAPGSIASTAWYTQWWGIGLIVATAIGGALLITGPTRT